MLIKLKFLNNNINNFMNIMILKYIFIIIKYFTNILI